MDRGVALSKKASSLLLRGFQLFPKSKFRECLHREKRTQLSCARDEAELCPYENVRLDTAQFRPREARMCERISLRYRPKLNLFFASNGKIIRSI